MASETAKPKGSSVFQMSTPSNQRQGNMLFNAQVGLRISAIVFTLIAISVILTNRQSVIVFGFRFDAHYSYSTAFKFLVGANVVVCAFSALSLIFVSFFLNRPPSQHHLKNYFFVLLHDTVMTVMMISGCAAATAIGYVGKYGEKNMTWQPTCGYVSKFCNRMSISLAFSYLAFFAYLFLTLLSAHSLMPRSTD